MKKMFHAKKNSVLIAIVVLFLCAAVIGIKSMFFQESYRVLAAIGNTISEAETCLNTEIPIKIMSGDFTVLSTTEEDGQKINTECRIGKTERQMEINISGGFVSLNGTIMLSEHSLKVQLPELNSKVFFYDYTQKTKGVVAEQIGEKKLGEINQSLKDIYQITTPINKKMNAKRLNEIYNEYKKLNFKKGSEELFLIDGKKQKCMGYEAILTKTDMEQICNRVKEQYFLTETVKNITTKIEENLQKVEDAKITIYIYKKKLAAVTMEEKNKTIQLQCLGGSIRMQNMKLIETRNGKSQTILELQGKTKKDTYEGTLLQKGKERAKLIYHKATGKFEVKILKNDTVTISAVGTWSMGKEEMKLDMPEYKQQTKTKKIKCIIKRGAEMKEMNGEMQDISTLGKTQWLEMQTIWSLFSALN